MMKVLGWRLIANFGHLNILPASGIMLIIIPVLARFSSFEITHLSDILKFLFSAFDAPIYDIPENMLRAFWISFLVTLSNLAFKFACPDNIKSYRDYADWNEHSIESTNFQLEHREEHGENGAQRLPDDLKQKYLELIDQENTAYPLLRMSIGAMLTFSAYLTLRIAADQFIVVAKITNWYDLLL